MSSCASELRSELGSYASDPEIADCLELLSRSEARDNLLPFCRYVTPWFETPAHIRYLAPFYEAVERGDIDRLMVEMPPRHGKTNLGLHFLAWYLGRNPTEQIVLASYNAMIAGHFGGKVRNLLSRAEFARLADDGFGADLDPELKGRELWQTLQGGVFRAAGMNAGTSGFGGNGLYIDDFVKGREDADSETTRQKIAETYSAELYPRLMPRGGGRRAWVVMTYTPWHELDLGQEEVTQMRLGNGDLWWIVRLPAVAEAGDVMGRARGEALWPERYPREVLDRIKRVLDRINPRDWPALYQCRPAALEGTYYKREYFPDAVPTIGRRRYFMSTDWGAGGTDPTVHGVWAVDNQGDCELAERWAERCDTDRGTDAAIDYIGKYRDAGGIAAWIYAKGPIDRAVTPLVHKKMAERGLFCPIETYAETTNKETKGLGMQGRMAAGRVRFPHRAPWFASYLRNMLAFPGGADDNDHDMTAMLGMHLDKVAAPPKLTGTVTASADFRVFG